MIFDNCIIQAPDGVNLSRCGLKKVRWYLKYGLADIGSENPTTIRLKFEPSGRCGLEDPLLMDGKPNVCVVCGTPDDLTRHHIIPYCFIKYMNIEYKVDIIRDIFPCCTTCHNEYEKKSHEKKLELADRFGVPFEGINKDAMRRASKATGAAVALARNWDKIPQPRKGELCEVVEDFLGKKDVTLEEITEVAKYKISDIAGYICFPKYVAERVTDYSEFAREWREHFVEMMNPQFMPDAWKTDRRTEKVWVPRRMREQSNASTGISSGMS